MDELIFDLETEGLEGKILAGGFKLNHEPTWIEYPPFSEKTRTLLSDSRVAKVGHQVRFDIGKLRTEGYSVRGSFIDTRVRTFIKYPYLQLKLKPLCKELFGIEVIELKKLLEGTVLTCSVDHKHKKKDGCFRKKLVSDIDKNIFEGYLYQDIDLTYRLNEYLKQFSSDWFSEVEVPLTSLLFDLEQSGIYLDVSKLKTFAFKWESELNELKKVLPEINLNSPKQIKEYLEKDIGNTIKSTDYLSLIDLAHNSQFARNLIKYRSISKLVGTYVLPFIKSEKNGFIRGNFNQAGSNENDYGVRTGRLSSSDPNLQNIPSRTTLGKEFRSCFIAPSGMAMIVADASQIEPRFIAWYTRDEKLKDVFVTNKDFHGIVTQNAFSRTDFTKDERFIGKTIGLATMYDCQKWKLQDTLKKYEVNKSLEEVEKLRLNILNSFPTVLSWKERFKNKTRYSGGFTSFGGRFYPYNNTINLFNALIQSACADYFKLVMLNLESERYRIRNVVHDEVVIYVPIEEAEKHRDKIKKILETTISLGNIPIKAEVKICNSWAEK